MAFMPSTSRPSRSTMKNAPRRCLRGKPASTIAASSRLAMPQPAEPAPKTAMRCSVSGTPVTLMAASSVPVATAAVPWMSSLKVQSRSR